MKKTADPAVLSHWVRTYDLAGILNEPTMRHMELFCYENGELVFSDGDRLSHMLLIVANKLKLYKLLPNGRSVLLRFYKPLSVIGDVELLYGYPANCYAQAVGNACAIAVPMEILKETAFDDPRFLRFIIRQLSGKLLTMSNASSLNMLYPLENRLASYLVSISGNVRDEEEADEIRTPKLTEVAELLGTSYRHLNRVLSKLEKEGYLERKRGAIVVRDFPSLYGLAEGNLYK